MNRSMLVVGQEYAARRGKHGSAEKIVMLGIANATVSWNSSRRNYDHTVKWLTGRNAGSEVILQSRDILKPWAEYEVQYAAKRVEQSQAEGRRLLAAEAAEERGVEVKSLMTLLQVLDIRGEEGTSGQRIPLPGGGSEVYVNRVPHFILRGEEVVKLQHLLMKHIPALNLM